MPECTEQYELYDHLLPVFPELITVLERDLSCLTFPSYCLFSSFVQLYLYRLLAVIFAQGIFSDVNFTRTYSPRPNSLVAIPVGYRYARYEQIGYFQRLLVTFILRIRIKTSMRAYCGCVLFRCWGD